MPPLDSSSDTSEEGLVKKVSKTKKKRDTAIKSFHCHYPDCLEAYNRQWKLERHLCTHTGERPYICEQSDCNKSYQCKTHLLRHIRNAHMEKTKAPTPLLPCTVPLCKATFANKSSLVVHIKNHGKPREFQCFSCGVSFQKRQKYMSHQLTHRSPDAFACSVCKATWPSLTLLRRHTRSHRVRQCDYEGCHYTCQSRSLIRKHMALAHRCVYACDGCNKTFNNKGVLRDHVLVHLPAALRGAFACPFALCSRSYFQMRNLRHHVKVYHDCPRYYCSEQTCTMSFISKVKVSKHWQKKHGQPSEEKKLKLIADLATIAPLIAHEDSDNCESAGSSSTRDPNALYQMQVSLRDNTTDFWNK